MISVGVLFNVTPLSQNISSKIIRPFEDLQKPKYTRSPIILSLLVGLGLGFSLFIRGYSKQNAPENTSEKAKNYKSAYVFSIAKLESDKHERSKRSQNVLPKMQNPPNPHSHPIQSRKTKSPSQRRTPPQKRKKRLRRTEIPASTRIRQNNQKTNPKTQM